MATSDSSTTSTRPQRYGENYLELREQALERDKRKCCACYHDGSQYRLETHHRTPDGHPANRDDNYLKLHHLYTFCERCHDLWTDRDRADRYARRGPLDVPEVALSQNARPSATVKIAINIPDTQITTTARPISRKAASKLNEV